MRQLDVLVAVGVGLGHDLLPQDARLHHVVLLARQHLLAARAGEVEGDARDAVDLVGLVDLGVDGTLLAVAELGDLLGLAEIDAARQLPDDEQVEPFDEFGLERGRSRQRGIADRGPQIGEELQILAQAQETGLGTLVIGHTVPFGAADGAEDDGVGRVGLLHRILGDRTPVGVVRRAADQVVLCLEGDAAASVEPVDDAAHLRHHFLADPVAGEKKKLVRRHVSSFLAALPGRVRQATKPAILRVSPPAGPMSSERNAWPAAGSADRVASAAV